MTKQKIRLAIYDWIKTDAPLTISLVIIPQHIEDLINKIIKYNENNIVYIEDKKDE